MAARLGVVVKTVETHKVRIFEKLGVRSQAHAVTTAFAYGLVSDAPECSAEVQDDGGSTNAE